ncbi:cationic amino acid transporter 3-like [Onthophagus taurus]|uniref:cationic amino acid transporter 3-like n=1 Tax=Onthophagus taurus TaxID=166361 RepID=UPI000C209F2A|nr:cationic amino acid transporter 3-like [Onthophagus taurus]
MTIRCIYDLTRKKVVPEGEQTQLNRVLSLFDLTALGVGSTLGLGVYILAGSVARNQAGPATCISFLIAAAASAIAGLCYAEFASRVPKAGSAYVYSYVSVGEFAAYIIGWNLVLEYVIGTASLARGLSDYIDALANNSMSTALTETFPINQSFLSKYPDFLSLGFVILLTILLAAGVKESTWLNNIFTALNITTVLTVIISGSIGADIKNWQISKEDIPPEVDHGGEGGFAPFGISGIIAGAAKCFYAFVGFDTVATTADEAKNPKRNIPLAIVFSLTISFLVYFGISTVLTMMLPYYEQDAKAPFPHAFEQLDWIAIKWIVTIGAIFALCTSLIGAMFPLPRVIYAMASDGLLFRFLSKVHEKTKTPLIATVISGILSGFMAVMFDVDQLIEMMSIGTLLAYTIVAICVLVLRYTPIEKSQTPDLEYTKDSSGSLNSFMVLFKQLFNLNNNKEANASTSLITNIALTVYGLISIGICVWILFYPESVDPDEPGTLTGFIILCLVLLLVFAVIMRQPADDVELSFKVPLVPLIPCVSITVNICLMLMLEAETWIRFAAWLAVGFVIYFGYGIRKSSERNRKEVNMVMTEPKSSVKSEELGGIS